MLTMLLVPVLLVEVPPILDYPNHLARCYVLAFGGTDPILQQMVTANWRLIPNLAVDLVRHRCCIYFPFLTPGGSLYL